MVHIYLSTSPCHDCTTELVKFVNSHNGRTTIHVRYTSFYFESIQEEFDRINYENPRLSIQPFELEDWKILVRALRVRIGNRR